MYDPWLEYRLRLADRRGLLTGMHLSRVQARALELVMVMEAREQTGKALEAFKLALVSANPAQFIPVAFPEWTTKTDEDITVKDLTDSAGSWTFEQEMTQEEIEATLADLMGDGNITLTADDLDGVEVDEDWDDDSPPGCEE